MRGILMKYEYEIINRDQAERVDWVADMFNEMGSAGWRLCVVSDWFFAFERGVTVNDEVLPDNPDYKAPILDETDGYLWKMHHASQ
jgi:hypothetical protein